MRDGNWKLVAAAFLASQCLTLVGSSAVQMAIAWYVAVETSSGAWAAAMLVAGFVPQMAVSPFAGAWIDRRGFRKAAIIAADAVSAATALALAVFLATSFGDMAALVAASSVRSLCAGVQMPAVQSSVAILVPEEALLRYNGIVSAVQNVAQFAAVPLAALTLSFGGISSAMLLDVVTAAVAVGVLAVAVKLPRVEATSCALSQEKADLFEDVREGARYARDERAVGFVLASYGAFIFLSVPSGFFVPLLMERAFDASYAMLAFAEGAGCFSMVVGGVVLAAFADGMKGVALPLGLITYGAGSMGRPCDGVSAFLGRSRCAQRGDSSGAGGGDCSSTIFRRPRHDGSRVRLHGIGVCRVDVPWLLVVWAACRRSARMDASYVVRGCGCAVRRDVSAANDFFASTGSGLLQMRALPITARSIACAN